MKKWKIILCPMGSWGDVHPFMWIGKNLVRHGHEVVAIIGEPFEAAMQHVGVRTHRIGSAEEFEKFARHPDLWHPTRSFNLVGQGILDSSRPMIAALLEEYVPGNTLVLAGGIAMGARVASEAHGIPLVTVQLQPSVFISADRPALMSAGTEWLAYLPRPIRRLLIELVYAKVDSVIRKGINEVRHEHGLTGNVRRLFRDWWMSPQGVIALFPEWFAPKAADWPKQTHLTRFPLYDENDRVQCPPELDAFLRSGPPPVLFTPGSANSDAKTFFAEAAKTCEILKQRGLFVTRYPEQVPLNLPDTIKTFAFVPFSLVFPRCAVVVQHGGIGTSAQGLAAGVPQLVMALSHDQPDNGQRLRRLGVGDYVYPKNFRATFIAPILDRLIHSREVAAACAKCKQLIENQMTEEDFAQLVEKLGREAGLE